MSHARRDPLFPNPFVALTAALPVGFMARSDGQFAPPISNCDPLSFWERRTAPAAGEGRMKFRSSVSRPKGTSHCRAARVRLSHGERGSGRSVGEHCQQSHLDPRLVAPRPSCLSYLPRCARTSLKAQRGFATCVTAHGRLVCPVAPGLHRVVQAMLGLTISKDSHPERSEDFHKLSDRCQRYRTATRLRDLSPSCGGSR